ncbi:MAG: DUF3306 domain-containing protein [Hyphomicrobiales bacterium]|nr:DUF3306 domain-containing protein [Hyphomicrobiales bacterium]
MADQTSESFLARWSRCKAQDRTPCAYEPRPAVAVAAPAPGSAEVALTTAPDADCGELEFASDFSQLLRSGTAEAVQIRALRRLWLTSPLFGASDGLDVYTADYTRSLPLGTAADAASNVLGILSSTSPDADHSAIAPDAKACPAEEVVQIVVDPAADDLSSS